jgi:hypothetical protein
MCTFCKLRWRETLYSFLWADFGRPSAPKQTEYFNVTALVLDIVLMVNSERNAVLKAADNASQLDAIGNGEKALLMHLIAL